MPFVEGESLRDRLNRETQLPVEVALRIAIDAARALEYAHEHGVVHRDIKPENLLLTKDGSTLVADFGIARALSAGDERLTATGLSVGTPTYMSPEQAAGDRHLDARTDVYSLGTVLYEMLAGEPPFTGATAQTVIAKRFSGEVPRLRHVRPSVPESVEHAVTRALAPVAADRFASAAEFVRALQATRPHAARRRPPDPLGALLSLPATGAGGRNGPGARRAIGLGCCLPGGGVTPAGTTRAAAKRLAVLPFENLGDSADAYFADGMANAVRGKLTALPGLASHRPGELDDVQQDQQGADRRWPVSWGCDYLLTGTVRWAKVQDQTSRVLVKPELVEVREAGAPADKWQQPFDAAMTDVFQVQADIAGRVAQALNVALGARDRQQLAQRPTADLAAYDAFLRGEAAAHALAAEDVRSIRLAAMFYEDAVSHDSTFGLAWARLGEAHAILYGYSSPSPAEAQAARRALAKAERLAPNAPETYRAQAEYEELVRRDFTRALAAAEEGLARAPEQSELMALAAIQEWRLGRVAAAVSRLTQAQTVDPRSVFVLNYLGAALCYQRRWSEARRALDRALSVAPTNIGPLAYRAMTYAGEGDLAGARRVLAEAPPAIDRTGLAVNLATEEYYWVLDKAAQQQVLTLPTECVRRQPGRLGQGAGAALSPAGRHDDGGGLCRFGTDRVRGAAPGKPGRGGGARVPRPRLRVSRPESRGDQRGSSGCRAFADQPGWHLGSTRAAPACAHLPAGWRTGKGARPA